MKQIVNRGSLHFDIALTIYSIGSVVANLLFWVIWRQECLNELFVSFDLFGRVFNEHPFSDIMRTLKLESRPVLKNFRVSSFVQSDWRMPMPPKLHATSTEEKLADAADVQTADVQTLTLAKTSNWRCLLLGSVRSRFFLEE